MSTKNRLVGEHSINTGIDQSYEIDLEQNEGYQGGAVYIDALGYTKASVSFSKINAGSTTGTGEIKQSNSGPNAESYSLNPAQSIDFSANNDAVFSIEITARFLMVDLSAVTFGQTGKVKINIIAKR